MTAPDILEYAWNPQTAVSLTEPSPNSCLTSDKPDRVEQDDQNLLNLKLNSTHMIQGQMKLFNNQNQIRIGLIKHKNEALFYNCN